MTHPSPAALRAATALISGGRNEAYQSEGQAYLSVDDIDGDCLFADTTVPRFDMLGRTLELVRAKVAEVIDREMRRGV